MDGNQYGQLYVKHRTCVMNLYTVVARRHVEACVNAPRLISSAQHFVLVVETVLKIRCTCSCIIVNSSMIYIQVYISMSVCHDHSENRNQCYFSSSLNTYNPTSMFKMFKLCMKENDFA